MTDNRPHAPRPVARRAAILLGLPWLLALPASTQAAPANPLLGKWQAEAMEADGKRHPVKDPMKIVFEFASGGKFIATMTYKENVQRKEGTWSASGNELTMTIDAKTEKMTYTITGAQLRMEKTMAGKTMVHHMKRLP